MTEGPDKRTYDGKTELKLKRKRNFNEAEQTVKDESARLHSFAIHERSMIVTN
jgi:hypothetical protein